MSRNRDLSIVAIVVGLLLTLPSGAPAQLNEEQQICLNAMNKAGSKVAAAQGKLTKACVKNGARGKELDPQECLISDRKGKLVKATSKTFQAESRCFDALPPFGFTNAATVNQAAIDHELALVTDIFGSDLNTALIVPGDSAHPPVDPIRARCQADAAKAWEKLVAAKLKAFNACKKAELKGKSGVPVASAQDLESACMETGGAGMPDPKGKINKARSKLSSTVEKSCLGAAVDLGVAFPGACVGALDFAQCLDERVECRVCLMLNEMDALAVDCDLFDDGISNGSCDGGPGTGGHKCVLEASSVLLIETQSSSTPLTLSGSLDITCGQIDPNTGKAACSCELQQMDPIDIAGIGTVCLSPAAACPAGEIDCDGGNSLDIDLTSDHNIGTCTDNADCAASCAAYCPPAMVSDSGCEGFCEGGANDDLACTADTDCPGGFCNGADGLPHGNICGCQCTDMGGPPSAAGAMKCHMGVDTAIEAAAPCDGTDVLFVPGQRCVSLTTETATSILTNANGTGAKNLPPGGTLSIGSPPDCLDLATSISSGTKLVGSVHVFDSALGDLVISLVLTCQ